MQKVLNFIVVIVVIIAGAYFILHSNSKTTITNVNQNPLTNTKTNLVIDDSLTIEKTYKAPEDKYTTFKVVYPQFKNASAEFNQTISDQVNAGIAGQKKNASENWQARYDTQTKGENIPQYPKETDKFYFNVSWKPVQENDKFISIILTVSAFEGGAHGYETLTSYNYDVTNKKEVDLSELFSGNSNYLKTLSDFSRKSLEAQFRKNLNIKTKDDEANFKDSIMPMLISGTAPTTDNFSVFTFTNTSITIYFNQYQVGPYSMGQSTVVFSRDTKKPDLLDP